MPAGIWIRIVESLLFAPTTALNISSYNIIISSCLSVCSPIMDSLIPSRLATSHSHSYQTTDFPDFLNLTTVHRWRYTLFQNRTLSNGSSCFLMFSPYSPSTVLDNGTMVNSTSCYTPILAVQARGILGLLLAILSGFILVFTLHQLRSHGKQLIPSQKHPTAVGRRWQSYWQVALCVCAIISGGTSVDIDRYYVTELPNILNAFFYFLALPLSLALLWEGVRHWVNWRKEVRANELAVENSASMKESRLGINRLLPISFYLFMCLVCLLHKRSRTMLILSEHLHGRTPKLDTG